MLLLATAYERGGSIELAEEQFTDAMNVPEATAEVGMSHVSFLKRRGRSDRAATVLEDLTRRFPSDIQILSALADLKLIAHQWADAEALAETIKRVGGAESVADQILGASYSFQHKDEAAITAYQAAVAAAPDKSEPPVALVGALVRAKKADRAKAVLQETVTHNPNNAEACVLLGEMALSNGDGGQAETQFKTAIQRRPKIDIGHRALGDLYARQKRWDDALGVIQSGLSQLPDSAFLRLSLATALEGSAWL